MRSQMAKFDIERIERGQHILRMLLHRIVGIVCIRFWPIAFATAAPVNAYHPKTAWEQRCGKLDPVFARKIAVDENDGDIALPPFPPAQLNLSRLQPCHDGSIC